MALYGLGMTSERVCECGSVGGANVCEWNVCVLTAERERAGKFGDTDGVFAVLWH